MTAPMPAATPADLYAMTWLASVAFTAEIARLQLRVQDLEDQLDGADFTIAEQQREFAEWRLLGAPKTRRYRPMRDVDAGGAL